MSTASERKQKETTVPCPLIVCMCHCPLFSTDVTIEDEGDKKGKDL